MQPRKAMSSVPGFELLWDVKNDGESPKLEHSSRTVAVIYISDIASFTAVLCDHQGHEFAYLQLYQRNPESDTSRIVKEKIDIRQNASKEQEQEKESRQAQEQPARLECQLSIHQSRLFWSVASIRRYTCDGDIEHSFGGAYHSWSTSAETQPNRPAKPWSSRRGGVVAYAVSERCYV